MNALNPFTQPIPDSVSATLSNTDATLCRFNRGRTLFSGQYLAVGQLDGQVTLWDVETRSILRVLEGHVKPVSSISWSACNRYIASASSDWNVIVWDLAARGGDLLYSEHRTSAAAGPSSLSGAVDEDAAEEPARAPRAARKRTVRFDAPVASAEFAPDDSRKLLVVLETQEAFLVDMREKIRVGRRRRVRRAAAEAIKVDDVEKQQSNGGGGFTNGTAACPSTIPLAEPAEVITYEDVMGWPTRIALRTEPAASDAIKAAAGITAAKYAPRGDKIFAGTPKGAMLVFDADTAELLGEHKVLGTASGVRELAFDRSGKHLVVNTNDRAVRILNVATSVRSVERADDGQGIKRRKLETELVMLHKYQDLVNRTPWNGIGFSGDSDYVVGGAAHKAAHNVYIWDRSAGTLVKILEGPKDSLIDVDWHPERPMLASVSNTGAIYIWFTATEEIWSAYAPGFEELEENVEYAEREDEFDLEDEEEVTRRKQDEEEALVNTISLGPATSAHDAVAGGASGALDDDDRGRGLDPVNLVAGSDTGWRVSTDQSAVAASSNGGDAVEVGDNVETAAVDADRTGGLEAAAPPSDWIWQEREAIYYVEDDDCDRRFVIPPSLEDC